PRLGMPKTQKLYTIPGIVPDPLNHPPGCKFHPRCPQAGERCKEEEPPLTEVEDGHLVACWLYHDGR
ncbi:oligopeptide ABC transporter ATP-binding protein, partial [Candidatus Poribacteria bacterium]